MNAVEAEVLDLLVTRITQFNHDTDRVELMEPSDDHLWGV